MATPTYESALHLAESLSLEEQLRLIEQLPARAGNRRCLPARSTASWSCAASARRSGRESTPQEYVNRERASWNG